MAMASQDPRSSSTQSLVPDPALENTGRRRLLLVYIHGFMGNETSFRSFPAHVHNLVTLTLAESHIVHTKLYPRYKSRNALEVARDDFSKWLAPHEDQWTDVFLLGHSMGGLLAADIALVFRHRIIGIINFDVPFLGMHPSVVKAGLGSIFSPSPAPQDVIIQDPDAAKRPSGMATIFNPKPSDPNYNPAFPNDVQLPVRKGWENSLHWLTKHYSDGLRQATKGLVKSHLEFGSAMADYRELKDRYARVRGLEEEDDKKRSSAYPGGRHVPRVRFINYYTASTGRPKKPKTPKSPMSPALASPSGHQLQKQNSDAGASGFVSGLPAADYLSHHVDSDRASIASSSQPEMTHVDPEPMADSPRTSIEANEHHESGNVPASPQNLLLVTDSMASTVAKSEGAPNLPEIPPIPKEPPFVDLMQLTDKAQRKAAEKEHDRNLKEYQKAVKARNKAINERTKVQEKWEKEKEKEEAKDRSERKRRQAETEKKELEKQQEQSRLERESMSAEAKMRESEARQRQAEAAQRQKEAEERMTDAERRALQQQRQSEEAASTLQTELEEPLGAVELGKRYSPQPDSQAPYAQYDFSRSVIMSQAPPDDRVSVSDSGYTLSTTESHASHQTTPAAGSDGPAKPKKLKTFCMLPPKDVQGNKDPTWVKVVMEGIDEVTAHTTLFFVSETYERLVGDVGDRIEEWIREADSVRLVWEMEGLA